MNACEVKIADNHLIIMFKFNYWLHKSYFSNIAVVFSRFVSISVVIIFDIEI
ncbi:hypothetical protein TEHD23766T_1514 [Tetragenococcus halophilus subsp. flandriensis]|nr:hypothetical protein TEHD23766T_1514 [Tetragenococcus halophilus subsp. flandriensis]